jgi:hypothetical protein
MRLLQQARSPWGVTMTSSLTPFSCPDADFSQELGAPPDRQCFVRDSLSRPLQNKPATSSYQPSASMPGRDSNLGDEQGDHKLDAK